MKKGSCRICVISLALILTLPFVFLPNAALASEITSTSIDFPGASYTLGFGINDSRILVGYYGNSTGEHGYFYNGASFTAIDVPGASSTVAIGISDSGLIVGYYSDSSWRSHGYIYNAGKLTYPIDFPGASNTAALAINDSGMIAGYYIDASYRYHGYVYDGVNFTSIDVPGSSYTVAYGINNSGIIVGYYDDAKGEHGYIYNGGKFTYPIDVPGASYTDALGIDDSGIIVGYYGDATENHGYLYTDGNFTYPIDVPGASSTQAFGINNSGILSGFYTDATGGSHGFEATLVSQKTVSIDIRPYSHLNSINPKSKGKIAVAILSTKDFDAPSQVDRNSLTFGRTGDEQSLAFCNHRPEHVNRDGLKDLVCHFYTQDTGFQCGDTKGILKGKTLDGTPIEGSDSVRIEPCKKVPDKQENKRKGFDE